MRRNLRAVVVAGIAVLAAPCSNAATILAPNSTVAGQSIADWTAGWWSRYWQYPATAIDPATGDASAALNNNGPVFYIPTTDGDPTLGHVTINITAPLGKPILVPVLPFDDLEPASFDGFAPLADRQHAADVTVAGWKSSVNIASLFATIDGNSVSNVSSYLEQTGYFSAGPTEAGGIAAVAGVTLGDDLSPNEAAGYWLMIDGLTPGEHTVKFGGTSNAFTPEANCCTNFQIGPFAVDVTATIDVVPEPPSVLLMLAGILATIGVRNWRPRHVASKA